MEDPALCAVQRGARSEWVRPTGGFRAAVNQQNPLKPDVTGTSDPDSGPASESAKERETEPMAEAPLGGISPTRKWVRRVERLVERRCAIDGCADQGRPGNRASASGKACKARGRIPHGVESAPKADEGATMEPGNPPAFPAPSEARMIEATDERARRGRSPHSSPRTGKPSTWRRQAVDTVCKQEMDVMSDTVNTGFVLDMQRKLYRWSAADTDKVFADLFNLVCDRRTIAAAWQRLSRNKGSKTPGTDRVTRKKVEEAARWRRRLSSKRSGKNCATEPIDPEPVRQRLIPKPGKPGKFRPLGIPTLKDRLVQMALKLVLEPIFEADFYPTSYGFRPGRSTHDALARMQRRLHPDNGSGPSRTRYVIEGDIKGCFDAIDHHVLMDRVRRRIKDRKVLRLILAFLKADIMIEGNLRHPVTGTPQGGIISPLLANVYLTAIDERYGRWSPRPREEFAKAAGRRTVDRKAGRPTFFVVRYADDFVVLVEGTLEQAEARTQRAGGVPQRGAPHGAVD